MRLIDADALAKVKFHGYPEIEITPFGVNTEAYKRGWNDAIDAIIESAPSIDAVKHGYLDVSAVVFCNTCKVSAKLEDNDQEGFNDRKARMAVDAWNKRVYESVDERKE